MVLNVHRNHKAYWGKGVWRWRRRSRLYTYLYNVTSRMIPALRWAAMRAILMFSVGSDEQSHRTVSTNHNLFQRVRRYGGRGRERVYTYRYTVTTSMTGIKIGSDESHFNVLLIVKDKVTRQCPQTTASEEKGQPKRIRTEVPLLTSLTPYR